MKSFSDKLLWGIIVLLAAAMAITAAVKLSPLLNPPQDISLPLNAACDLHQGPCTTSLPGGGRLEFSLEPRPIPVLRPLRLQVRATGIKADSVEVDFAGVDMKMAFNRPRLVSGKEGLFTGEATLPVCVRNKMAWQATVLVEADGQRIAVPFRFETKR
ncbi:hypothetical protein SCD_n01918 [Sulfuricella denitrificans skB26]|uniref:YtkA-like domain-containing protein n=1 Tax=Sulfuricella denitrificans (strain DSM 22764 / NBRC 105220 / skB26) TaxID=1163617 RepID=S6AM01_SULDS|nr:hypothetical protein [Sulfuricella denitrificans]BAN35729.1 hypothetical protein SCD_n01918 [Sulfuricella denitrificans skB26]